METIDNRPELPVEKAIELLNNAKDILNFDCWVYDTIEIKRKFHTLLKNYPEYQSPAYLIDCINEVLVAEYFRKGIKPELPRSKFYNLLTQLKDGIGFQDMEDDHRYLSCHYKSLLDQYPEYLGPYCMNSYIDDFLEDLYFSKRKYAELIDDRCKWVSGWSGDFQNRIRNELKKHSQENLLVPYLRSWLDSDLRRHFSLKYQASLEEKENDPDTTWRDRFRRMSVYLTEAYKAAAEICDRCGADAQRNEFYELSAKISADDFRETLAKAESTKMNEQLFWSVLREAFLSSSVPAERADALGTSLRKFNTTAIRKFASLYKRSIKKLNDYRAWDFVYIMEGGCGDDSFIDFKDTIVFLGRPELIGLILERPVEAAELLSTIPNVDLKEEYGLSSVIDFACLARSGRTIEWAGQGEPRGKMLEEEEIYAQYPELSQWVDKHGYLS